MSAKFYFRISINSLVTFSLISFFFSVNGHSRIHRETNINFKEADNQGNALIYKQFLYDT